MSDLRVLARTRSLYWAEGALILRSALQDFFVALFDKIEIVPPAPLLMAKRRVEYAVGAV